MKLTVTIDEADFIVHLIERASKTYYQRQIKENTQGSVGMAEFYFQLSELCDDLAFRIGREVAQEKGREDLKRRLAELEERLKGDSEQKDEKDGDDLKRRLEELHEKLDWKRKRKETVMDSERERRQ